MNVQPLLTVPAMEFELRYIRIQCVVPKITILFSFYPYIDRFID